MSYPTKFKNIFDTQPSTFLYYINFSFLLFFKALPLFLPLLTFLQTRVKCMYVCVCVFSGSVKKTDFHGKDLDKSALFL